MVLYSRYLKQYLGYCKTFGLIGILYSGFVFLAHADEPSIPKMPSIKVMPEMDTEWVAEQILYNGIPMSVQNFKSKKPVKDVLYPV